MFPSNERVPVSLVVLAALPGLAGIGICLWLRSAGLGEEWWRGPEAPGRWALVTGILSLALALASLKPALRQIFGILLPIAAIGAAVFSIGILADASKHDLVFGEDVWWLDDDMMITLRYGQNIAAGHGPVWNPGEWMEGITNILWAAMLAPMHWIFPQDRAALGAIILNAVLYAFLVALLALLVRRAGARREIAGLAGIAIATCTPALHWAAAGGEATLVGVLLLTMAWILSRNPSPRGLFLAGALGGLSYAARPDAILSAGVWASLHLLLTKQDSPLGTWKSRWLHLLLGFATVPVLLTLFRLLLYGEVVPNTWFLKGTGWEAPFEAGWLYVKEALIEFAPFLVAAGLGALVAPGRVLPPLAGALAHFAYLTRIGGDELPEQRFIVPALPLLFVAAFVGIDAFARKLPKIGAHATPAVALAGLLLILGGQSHGLFPGSTPSRLVAYGGGPEFTNTWDARKQAEWGNAMVGKLIEANSEPDAKVAHFWAGAAAYFSNRPGIDFYGKCDPVVAKGEAHPKVLEPGHNKWNFDHSFGLEPDIVVGGLPGNSPRERIAANAQGPYRAFSELYLHPTFRSEFGPFLVQLAKIDPNWPVAKRVSMHWHGIFVRKGSAHSPPPGQWQIPR